MKKIYKNYDEEFKKRAVEFVYSQEITIKEASKNLDIPESTLRDWCKKYGPRSEYYPNIKAEDNQEIIRLKKELSRTKEERDILKKALTIFSLNK